MATDKIEAVGKLSVEAQRNVIKFAEGILAVHRKNSQMQDKMDAIDVAYARYKASPEGQSGGVDNRQAPCGDVFNSDDITPPIVVSQVDSHVAYLADVFLSGTPLFPVVSNPGNRKYAEQLETLLDDHATIGGYARQLLLMLRDGVKYNFCASEFSWDAVNQFSVGADFTTGTGRSVNRNQKYFTRIKRLNMRNVVRDMLVAPGDISEHGDYAGYIELVSKIALKRELNKLTTEGKVYNADKAISHENVYSDNPGGNYRHDPEISHYVSASTGGGTDWDAFFEPEVARRGSRTASYGTQFERFAFYARIMPADLAIRAPQPNTPQIWKFVIINGKHLIEASRIISAFDYLPILFGQPLEDGLRYQTQTVAESAAPFQQAASTLYNIRFAAARRAVSDRALYIPEMISQADVNARGPAPKIPVRISQLSNMKLGDAYHPIPFDTRGLETVMQDAQAVASFSKELHGLNSPRQGQFQKGNKSVREWDDTMAGSDNRLRLPAMTLEHQFFGPAKSILTLNIFQYGDNAIVVSQKTGEVITIDITELRKQVLAFKIADGYTPKSKLASSEAINQGMTLLSTSQILQQAYGASLPAMFAHLMQLAGVKGLEEYDPNYRTPQAPAGLAAQVAPAQQTAPPEAMQQPQGAPMMPPQPTLP